MLKRRSTLDSTQQQKRNKITEHLLELDKCLQIPNDHKLVIRNHIKQEHTHILALFEQLKKDKNYSQLQLKLRKFLQGSKEQQKRIPTLCSEVDRKCQDFSQRVYSQNSQGHSYKNSTKCSPDKEEKKKIITFDISQLKRKIEDCHQNVEVDTPSQRNLSVRMRADEIKTQKQAIDSQKHLPKFTPMLYSLREHSQLKKNESNRSIANIQNDFSKVTLRIKESQPNLTASVPIHINGSQEKQKVDKNNSGLGIRNNMAEDINSNVSFSSSIRNLLIYKLKDQKQNSRVSQKITLKNSKISNRDQKSQLMERCMNLDYAQKKQDHGQNKLDDKKVILKRDKSAIKSKTVNRQSDQSTVIKKPAKPILRDHLECAAKLFCDQPIAFPMYLKTDDDRPQDSIFTVRDRRTTQFSPKTQTSKQQQSQLIKISQQLNPKFGQFYNRIRQIIDSDTF